MNMNVVSQEFAQKICEDMKEHYPFLEIKPVEEDIEKIAKAKNMMFGDNEWQRCPCDGNNEKRYCISELCRSDIERDGICHCRCYQKASSDK